VIPNCDFSLLLVFFFLFALSSIAQSLLFSTFFTNANIATAFTAIVVFLCFFPFELSGKMKSEIMTKLSLVLPQTAMGFGMSMIANGDDNGEARWATMGEMQMDGLFLSDVMIALAVDTVIFCVIAWYISAIHPG
ncbi:hypothetical protein PFISCL1PPCAC_28491, partial [Pristionchus fissidentatus]